MSSNTSSTVKHDSPLGYANLLIGLGFLDLEGLGKLVKIEKRSKIGKSILFLDLKNILDQ